MSTAEAMQVADPAALSSPRWPTQLLRRLLFVAGFVVLAWLVSGTREAFAADPLAAYAHQQVESSDPALALTTATAPARRVTDLGSVPAGVIGRGAGRIPVERGTDIAPTLLSSLPVAQTDDDAFVVVRQVAGILTHASRGLDTVVGQRGLAHGLGSAPLGTAQGPSAKPAIVSSILGAARPSSSSLALPAGLRPSMMSAHGDSVAALAADSLPYPLPAPDRSGLLQLGAPAPASHGAVSGQGSADGGQPALIDGYGGPHSNIVGYVTAPVHSSAVRPWSDQPGTSPD
jgi:hypothetical protein